MIGVSGPDAIGFLDNLLTQDLTRLAQAGVLPRVSALRSWFAHHRDLWPRFLGEFLTVTGGLQLAFLILGAVAGLAAGADGLLIEVHPQPERALSDGAQSLDFDQFDKLLERLKQLAGAFGRKIN